MTAKTQGYAFEPHRPGMFGWQGPAQDPIAEIGARLGHEVAGPGLPLHFARTEVTRLRHALETVQRMLQDGEEGVEDYIVQQLLPPPPFRSAGPDRKDSP